MASPTSALIEAFEARFHRKPDLFRAPGRVNLIGEHTDYNLGWVLPMAINLACYTASAPNGENLLRVYTGDFDQAREWPLELISALKPSQQWSDYVIGVARLIPNLVGRDLMIHSAVPVGAGLSSSAALEVAVAFALGWNTEDSSKLDLAKLCQRAENEFVGMPSGIMDQYISVLGQENAALAIDCRSLESEPVPLPDSLAFVAVNSQVKHELGQSAYRIRVAECKRAVEAIRQQHPEVESLRDTSPSYLELIADRVARQRARHVLTENQRVLDFIEAARAGNHALMGELLVQSHRSLQHDYEVSCAELDFLVDRALEVPGVLGARMTGGGFGGCTVNLMSPDAVPKFKEHVASAYAKRFGLDAVFYRVRPAAGAAQLA